jgi:hypothetical protein
VGDVKEISGPEEFKMNGLPLSLLVPLPPARYQKFSEPESKLDQAWCQSLGIFKLQSHQSLAGLFIFFQTDSL